MESRITERSVGQALAAVHGLDLEPIRLRVMDPKRGKGWTSDHAARIEREYRAYLAMLVKHPEAIEKIVVGEDVDEFWHTHILHTMKYTDDCQRVFGTYLHHNPQDEARSSADIERTRLLYQQESVAEANNAAMCAAAIRADNAAMCAAAIRADNAAMCAAAIRADNAAMCAAAVRADNAAMCAAAIRADNPAMCAAAVRADNAAMCAAAIRADNAAMCAAAIRADNAAMCAAAVRADNAAMCAAAIRPAVPQAEARASA
jgi:hypothetical protein